MTNSKTYLFVPLLFLLFQCEVSKNKDIEKSKPSIECITLLNDTLYTPTSFSETALENAAQAKARYLKRPNNVDSIIWYGRRTAYLGKFNDAIDIYSNGIKKHPNNPRLYRHRGHRYLSTRKTKLAIADFEKAQSLIVGKPDIVEQDGLPNKRNIPLSTLHGNIYYHLGLGYYLDNRLEEALTAFNNRTVTEKYPDNLVSGAHWQYMILRRLERHDEAQKVVSKIIPDLDIIENDSYYKMGLLYNKQIPLDSLEFDKPGSPSNDVLAYGVANFHLYHNQDTVTAKRILNHLLDNGNKYSFAYLAAESDWNRLFKI